MAVDGMLRTSMLSLLLLTAACGGQEVGVPERLAVRTIYQEPADSEDPGLVMVRDLLPLGDRLFALDGRLAHVVVLGSDGEVKSRFGGPGEGPGELGRFPWGLVTDGRRVGVASLLHISWFTPVGRFLERERLPAGDLMNPSIQHSGGWVLSAACAGERGPLGL